MMKEIKLGCFKKEKETPILTIYLNHGNLYNLTSLRATQ